MIIHLAVLKLSALPYTGQERHVRYLKVYFNGSAAIAFAMVH